VAHILPERGLSAVCDHGFPIVHPCELCRYDEAHPPAGRASASPQVQHGWSCPGCGHSYAPWVPECHHCPVSFDPGPIEIDGCP
jgi:hypothetical protein